MSRSNTWRLVARGLTRHPRTMGRIARDLGAGRAWNVGRTLAAELDSAGRRRAAAALLRDEGVIVRFDHSRRAWSIPSGDLILAEMLAVGAYETEELPAVVDRVRRERPMRNYPFVVEVGANVGTTTIPLCESGYRVLALEPVPRLRAILEDNLVSNGHSAEVIVQPYAIAEVAGTAIMREGDSGSSELVTASIDEIRQRRGSEYFSGRQAEDGEPRELRVETRTLVEVLVEAGLGPRDVAFVWSDTEGAEAGVIAGGKSLWEDGVPLWVEVWPAGLDEHGGLDAFLELTATYFVGFIRRDELIDLGKVAPVHSLDILAAELHQILRTHPAWTSTDLMLVPRGFHPRGDAG